MGSSPLTARRSSLTPRPARAPHEQQPTNLRSRRRPSRLLPPPPPHTTMVEMVRTSSPPRRATRCRHPESSLTSSYRAFRGPLVSSPCHDTLRFVASVMPLSPHSPPLSLPRRWLPSCSAPRAHTRCCRTTVNLSAHVNRCAGASALEQPPTKRPRSLPLSLGLPLLTAFTA